MSKDDSAKFIVPERAQIPRLQNWPRAEKGSGVGIQGSGMELRAVVVLGEAVSC